MVEVPQKSPPPLHRLKVILIPSAETVNHHPARAGEFSTGEMRNFQPALTDAAISFALRFPSSIGPSQTRIVPEQRGRAQPNPGCPFPSAGPQTGQRVKL